MKKYLFIFLLNITVSIAFSQKSNKITDLRDSFVGLYHTINPPFSTYPYSYYILVEKDLVNIDSLIINDSLWATGTTTVDCYQHKVKINPDSTWFQSLVYNGHFKKKDTIHLFFLMPGNPPTAYNYDAFKIYNSTNVKELRFSENDLLISPNPASNEVSIIFNNSYLPKNLMGQVLDMVGNEVMNFNISATTASAIIDTGQLPQGVYNIRINDHDVVYTKKLIVIK